MLQDAKTRLRDEILSRLDAAKKQKDHASVLRFTRLYAPLGLQVCPALPGSPSCLLCPPEACLRGLTNMQQSNGTTAAWG